MRESTCHISQIWIEIKLQTNNQRNQCLTNLLFQHILHRIQIFCRLIPNHTSQKEWLSRKCKTCSKKYKMRNKLINKWSVMTPVLCKSFPTLKWVKKLLVNVIDFKLSSSMSLRLAQRIHYLVLHNFTKPTIHRRNSSLLLNNRDKKLKTKLRCWKLSMLICS